MTEGQTYRRYFIISGMMYGSLWLMMPTFTHDWDTYCFQEWAKHIHTHGVALAYRGWTDYPPIWQYMLQVFVWFFRDHLEIQEHKHFIKLIPLIFHVLTGSLILKILLEEGIERGKALLGSMFYLFNIAVLFNNIIWNQVDIILGGMLLFCVYLAIRRKPVAALVMLVLTLNFKLQGLVYIPIIGLLVLPDLFRPLSLKKVVTAILLMAGLQVLILAPFIYNGTVQRVWEVAVESFGKYPSISAYAYNWWFYMFDGDLFRTTDATVVFGLSYNRWGLLAFCTASFFALWPLLKNCWLRLRSSNHVPLTLTTILLICGLIPLLFFYLNTQMHERYSHPALAFLVLYAILTGRYWPAILSCLAYFLNLEDELEYFHLNNYEVLLLDAEFIATLYLAAIILSYYYLYKPSLRHPVLNRDKEPDTKEILS